MGRVKYIGDNPELYGQYAIGRMIDGVFHVQVDGKPCGNRHVPRCMVTVNGRWVDWAYGWHKSPEEDWEKVPSLF